MTEELETRETRVTEEKIPRKVRDLIGRMSAKIEHLEVKVDGLKQPGGEKEEGTPDARVKSPENADAALVGTEPGVPGLLDFYPPELAAEIDRLLDAVEKEPHGARPSDTGAEAMSERLDVPAGAPGASTTPSTPPFAEDPERSAERRAESVETHLDSRYFGTE